MLYDAYFDDGTYLYYTVGANDKNSIFFSICQHKGSVTPNAINTDK